MFRYGALLFCFACPFGNVAAFSAEKVDFTYRNAAVGEVARQELSFNLQLSTTTGEADRELEKAKQSAERSQRRVLQLLEFGKDHAKARVTFESVTNAFSRGEESRDQHTAPVVGKSYIVTRSGDKLTITAANGKAPPADELEFVEYSMAGFGKSNPLSKYFDGRSIAIGETVRLPSELAVEAFGAEGGLDEVTRFDTRLLRLREVAGRKEAEFETTLQAQSILAGNLTLLVQGTMRIEPDTCRVVSTELSGPVGAYESKSVQGRLLTVKGSGTMSIAIRATRLPQTR